MSEVVIRNNSAIDMATVTVDFQLEVLECALCPMSGSEYSGVGPSIRIKAKVCANGGKSWDAYGASTADVAGRIADELRVPLGAQRTRFLSEVAAQLAKKLRASTEKWFTTPNTPGGSE